MTGIEKRKIILISALIFLLLPAVVFCAKWYESYEKAISNIEKGQFSAAITLLQDSISQKADSKSRVRTYGTTFIEYYPYYYLGLCYYNQQDYAEAIKWLEREEEYGQIQNSDSYDNLKLMLTQSSVNAKKTGKPVGIEPVITHTGTQTLTSTTTPPTVPSALETRIAGYLKTGKNFYNNREFEKALAEFNKALSEDRSNKEAAEWRKKTIDALVQNYIAQGERMETKNDYAGAAAAYQKAGQYLPNDKNIAARIKRVKDKLDQDQRTAERREKISRLLKKAFDHQKNGRLVEAKKAFEDVLKEDPTNTDAQTQIAVIDKQLLAQANTELGKRQFEDFLKKGREDVNSGNLGSAKESYDHAGLIDSENPDLKNDLTILYTKNKEKMKTGFEAYLKGDLSGAQGILKECALIEEKSPGLHAFIGSIAYTRYLLSGEKDDNLKTTADAFFVKARDLDRTFSLSPKIFSPSVISYFKQIR
jgi:tetratricopeptide (TPR) repeat protein